MLAVVRPGRRRALAAVAVAGAAAAAAASANTATGGAAAAAFVAPSSLSSSSRRPSREGPYAARNTLVLVQRRGFFEAAGKDWDETWRRQTTPWDTGKPAPPLLNLLQRCADAPPLPREPGKSRALVGGCGSGYDCWTLARYGWRVTGLDLSPTAVERARALLNEKEEGEGCREAWPGSVEFVCGDFFALPDGKDEDRFDLIFDYTFLCALPPTLRSQWATKTKRLLTPGHGQLVCLIFPVQAFDRPVAALNAVDGPPFEVSGPLYTSLLEAEGGDEEGEEALERLELSGPCPDSIKPRQGREWLGRWRRRPG